MNIAYRLATEQDYDFAFNLKKSAEYEPITAIFGWDEVVQNQMHAQEWVDGKPMLICVDGLAVGSYKIEINTDPFTFVVSSYHLNIKVKALAARYYTSL
jgi:hypothetical protein